MSMPPPEPESAPEPRRRRSNSWLVATLVGIASLCLISMVVVVALSFPVLRQARQQQRRNNAVLNMKDVATAIDMYAGDHDDRVPPAANWMDVTTTYVRDPREFHAPGLPRGDFGIALRESLAGKPLNAIRDINLTALVFDSNLHARNSVGSLSTLPKPPRYGNGITGGNVVGFSNGTSRLVAADEQALLK